MRYKSRAIALAGVFTSVAVLIMALGTIIPVATYTCPAICMVILQTILKSCGSRIAWAHYGAVSILSLLLATDKEAAVIFVFLGYYPIVKPWMDTRRGKWLWKAVYFNLTTILAYYIMMKVLGLDQVVEEISGAGISMVSMLLVLGNVTFFLLDRLLTMRFVRKR